VGLLSWLQLRNTLLGEPPKQYPLRHRKVKSAIHLARMYGEHQRNVVGQHFWARGYFVSTMGRDEGVVRAYIRQQPAIFTWKER
jgi:REP element-mobilizing transposase RayT